MSNFMIRVHVEPHPWPFRWGPFGTAREFVDFELNDGSVEIWQRDRDGRDGMAAEPVVVMCQSTRLNCTTKVAGLDAVTMKIRTQT